MKRKWFVVIFAVIAIVAGIGYFLWESNSFVAKVGSHKILTHEYTFFLRTQIKTAESEAGVTDEQAIKDFWESPVDGEDPVTIVMNQALENAKEFKIQLIKAEQEKFRLSESERKEIQEYLDELLKDKEYVQFVKNELGLTSGQYKDIFLKSQTIQSFSQDFMQKNRNAVEVSDEEVKAYYVENSESFDDVTVRHLLIQTNQDGLTAEQKKEKKSLAEDLLKRIQQGEDMVELIAQYSEDPSHTENEGVYTFTYTESYAQAFKDWAFQAEIGDLGLIETEFGYHIMRLEDKSTYDEKKELIKSNLKAKKLNEFYNSQVVEWTKEPAFNLIKNENVLYKITQKNIPYSFNKTR